MIIVIDLPKNRINIHKFLKLDDVLIFVFWENYDYLKSAEINNFISNTTKCYKNITKTLYLYYIYEFY